MLSVTKEVTFAAAHSLPYYDGPCFSLHGHEWRVLVTITGNVDPATGMIIDFVDLKKAMKLFIVDRFDHTHLNNLFENPTAENIIMDIVQNMQKCFSNVLRVRLYETPTSYAEWCA